MPGHGRGVSYPAQPWPSQTRDGQEPFTRIRPRPDSTVAVEIDRVILRRARRVGGGAPELDRIGVDDLKAHAVAPVGALPVFVGGALHQAGDRERIPGALHLEDMELLVLAEAQKVDHVRGAGDEGEVLVLVAVVERGARVMVDLGERIGVAVHGGVVGEKEAHVPGIVVVGGEQDLFRRTVGEVGDRRRGGLLAVHRELVLEHRSRQIREVVEAHSGVVVAVVALDGEGHQVAEHLRAAAMIVILGLSGPDRRCPDRRRLKGGNVAAVRAAAGEPAPGLAGAVLRGDALDVIVRAIPVGIAHRSGDRHLGCLAVQSIDRREDVVDLRIHFSLLPRARPRRGHPAWLRIEPRLSTG